MKLFITIAILIAGVCTGCHNYYQALKVNTADKNQAAQALDSLKLQERIFVLRNGNTSFYMKNLQINPEHTTLSCTLDTLPYWHHFVTPNKYINKQRYLKKDPFTSSILNEVHLYLPGVSNVGPGKYSLSLNQVQKIEVIQKDKKRTTNSYIIGGIGYTVGNWAILAALLLATKSSCPFVHAYDGGQFTLQGEIDRKSTSLHSSANH